MVTPKNTQKKSCASILHASNHGWELNTFGMWACRHEGDWIHHHLKIFDIMSEIWESLYQFASHYRKDLWKSLISDCWFVQENNKGKGKRKRDDAGTGEQPKEQEFGLVTNIDYHTDSQFSCTFQQTYEDYKTDKVSKHREEWET